MEIAITVSVIIAMIIIGVLMIHLLNGQHDERIAAFHYGDTRPGIGRRSRKSRRTARPAGAPVAAPHRKHSDEGPG
ncbi:hypothetical protein OHA27_18335 [Streptomyces sp. NBC_01619]|uniref:Uncharacterized protein n=1 Tax=Streptomyces pratisoli TaxID=3139917 RepID=A0ACC6QJZ9_9ACTN|nr:MULTISPECIES: hypothetical protein [unclassified Streptomyces]MCX4512226.1 hypothetical protein [Streptomyces sp. NBC_01619]